MTKGRKDVKSNNKHTTNTEKNKRENYSTTNGTWNRIIKQDN